MSIFAVTFRIDYDTDTRHGRCWKDLTDAIQAQSSGKYWSEPTSFYLIESAATSATIADAILAATPDFNPDIDLLLVINLSQTKGHSLKGKLQDPDFRTLMGRRST